MTQFPTDFKFLCKVKKELLYSPWGYSFPGGKVEEDSLSFGITHFCQKVAVKATKKRPPLEMARYLDSFGTKIEIFTEEHFFGFTVTLLSSKWKSSLHVLSDIVINASFPSDEVEKERKILLSYLIKREDKMSLYSIDLLKRAFMMIIILMEYLFTEQKNLY